MRGFTISIDNGLSARFATASARSCWPQQCGHIRRHVIEADHAEADATADGDAHSQMEAEEEPAAGDVALIEDMEEDSADASEIN